MKPDNEKQHIIMQQPPSTATNIPELTVSELAFAVKRSLEETFGRIRVRGELSKVKIHTSGHLYSDLKDGDSVINVVCWKGTLTRLGFKPEEGMDVICTGKLTTYPARSNYQLVIDHIEHAGAGALLKMLEDRKKKLATEGLFDPARKRSIPFIPQKIGIITSPTGAVIRDILHRLEDRFPRPVQVWPVRVQGETAAQEIIAAINGFNALAQKPDLLIIARGGGSLEDLMPFNDEALVRAVAASHIPTISAVGHETDTTLIDYAADIRAPTPTAAAEMAVPERSILLQKTTESHHRLGTATFRLIQEKRQFLATLAARLGDPAHLLDMRLQTLDRYTDKLTHTLYRTTQNARNKLQSYTNRLQHPGQRIALLQQNLTFKTGQLQQLGPRLFQDQTQQLRQISRILETLSFHRVLDRGFALIRDNNGSPITNSQNLESGQSIAITMKNTVIDAEITKITKT